MLEYTHTQAHVHASTSSLMLTISVGNSDGVNQVGRQAGTGRQADTGRQPGRYSDGWTASHSVGQVDHSRTTYILCVHALAIHGFVYL